MALIKNLARDYTIGGAFGTTILPTFELNIFSRNFDHYELFDFIAPYQENQ